MLERVHLDCINDSRVNLGLLRRLRVIRGIPKNAETQKHEIFFLEFHRTPRSCPQPNLSNYLLSFIPRRYQLVHNQQCQNRMTTTIHPSPATTAAQPPYDTNGANRNSDIEEVTEVETLVIGAGPVG